MSVFRSYFKKQGTIINGNFTNNSKNPIVEISYGGGTSAATSKFSRYIFKIDWEEIQNRVAQDGIMLKNILTHKIHLKNVVAQAKDFIGGEMFDAKRGGGVEVIIFPLTEDFDEGKGFDYLFNLTSKIDTEPAFEFPNWEYRKFNTKWTTPGIYSETPSEILDSQTLSDGIEDIELDITTHVNKVLNGEIEDFGLGIALKHEYESTPISHRHVITFFSKYTHTFYEPYLETRYEQVIQENRTKFYLDEDNALFLVSTKDIDAVTSVDIFNHKGVLLQTIPSEQVIKVKRNTYKINLNISSDNHPEHVLFRDVWNFTFKGKTRCHEQSFTILERDMFELGDINAMEHWFGINGLRHNEVVHATSALKRVNINLKRLNGGSIIMQPDVESIEYRVYTSQGIEQIEVIPFTPVNKLGANYFFELDFTWLIPQQYFMEVRIVDNGVEQRSKQVIRFRVVN
jgi:hypothetical protein